LLDCGTSFELPTIVSPKKIAHHDNHDGNGEKLPELCVGVLNTSTDNADCNEFDVNDNASGFYANEHFVDSDNDFGQDDDDLFNDNVDFDV
jgi:hypothetical protein